MKKFIAVLAFVAYLISSLAQATPKDAPNIFQPKRISSESIFAGVGQCLRSGFAARPQLGEQTWYIYCLCAADRIRMTRKQLDRRGAAGCVKHALKTPNAKWPFFVPRLVVPSHTIVRAVASCAAASIKSRMPWKFGLPYCGCLADAARLNWSRGLKTITESQGLRCKKEALRRFLPPAKQI